MKKSKKLTLDQLKVKSFVTHSESLNTNTIKGGETRGDDGCQHVFTQPDTTLTDPQRTWQARCGAVTYVTNEFLLCGEHTHHPVYCAP